jgi:hypothetical protein
MKLHYDLMHLLVFDFTFIEGAWKGLNVRYLASFILQLPSIYNTTWHVFISYAFFARLNSMSKLGNVMSKPKSYNLLLWVPSHIYCVAI